MLDPVTVIHYHGLPITPATAAARAIAGGHAFVSFRHRRQLTLAMEIAQSFAVDNGAFSAWVSGEPITEWSPYYDWIAELSRCPSFDFAVIPDVIDGGEAENDELVNAWPLPRWIGAPVWHLHESLERLAWLVRDWSRVCLGSSGQFARPGTSAWRSRMAQAMGVVCDAEGRPFCKLHGLRMLDPRIFTQYPFASADSTNIARNVGIATKWRGTYTPPSKEARAHVIRERIEAHQSPVSWQPPAAKPRRSTGPGAVAQASPL